MLHLVYPGVKLLDLAGPLQVFRDAGEYAAKHEAKHAAEAGCYRSDLISVEGGDVVSDVGVVLSTKALGRVRVGDADTIVVPGGDGVYAAAEDSRLQRWLRDQRPARLASTCTGAFLLAAAGLLDGRRAVTHWRRCARLQKRSPAAQIEPDPIYLRDGQIWTSAGVTAGIDLALAFVEEDLGRPVALELARNLVVYSKRPGGQSQFSHALQQQVEDHDARFVDLHQFVQDHLAADLRVEALAARCLMSPRTFHRLYTEATGRTPAKMVALARLEAARQLLEESELGVKAIALRCGFGGEEQLRRAFQRELGVSPTAYRETWAAP